jgi:outer membrane protein TolC
VNQKKNKVGSVLGLVFSFVFITGLGWAAELTVAPPEREPVTGIVQLEDLLLKAEEKSPEIIAARAEWLASKKRVWIDTSLPDPMGEYDLMGTDRETRVGPEMQRFVISQDIPFPWKLYEKGKMAHEEARAVYQRYQAIRRDILNKITKLYYELYFVDASIEVIEETKGLLKTFESVAQARYANLTGSQRDVAKAQAEVSMSLEKLFMLGRERESIVAMIHALLDEDPMSPLGKATLPSEKPTLEHSLVELVNLAVTNRQEIKEMEAMAAKSKHGKRLAKLAYIPDLSVGFEYIQVGGGTTTEAMDGQDQWMFPLRINIPLWQNRIIPEIQEAGKLQEAAQARLVQAKNETFYEVKDAYWRFDSAMKISELYETAVIPQANLALSADKAGYEGGTSDFLNLLDSERVYLNAKLTHVQFFTEALKSHADLVRATGLDLSSLRAPEGRSNLAEGK